jgi:hypothetical protein
MVKELVFGIFGGLGFFNYGIQYYGTGFAQD